MENILIVGGGASGVAAALSMRALNPNCRITLCEKRNRLGGMADSRVNAAGEEYNYGVQGVHESFEYSLQLVKLAREEDRTLRAPLPAVLSAQFVTADGTWNTENKTLNINAGDIQAFQDLCVEAGWAEDVYGLVDIQEACEDNDINPKLLRSAIIPTLALFFGTGQQQAHVPAAIAAQVFGAGDSPVQIFDLDLNSFITRKNNMLALPPLGPMYRAILNVLRRHNIDVQLNCHHLPNFNKYDKVLLCTQAEDAIRLLPPGHKAIAVLAHARYYDDVTVTHNDSDYMQETFGATDQFNYYMKNQDTMGFALHKYQGLNSGPLYQTIFLNTKEVPSRFSTAPADVWRQTVCSVDHLENCATQLKYVQGPHIYFAGSYTLVNSHEVAIMSGIRAAQLVLKTQEFPEVFGSKPNVAYQQFAQL